MNDQRAKDRMLPQNVNKGNFLFAVLLILGIAIGSHVKTLTFDLVWDDNTLIRQVRSSVSEKGLAGLFTTHFLFNQVEVDRPTGFYRPWVMASLWLDDRVGGGRSLFFHLTNVLLHGANALLVFLLLRAVLGTLAGAFLGALVFALHPAHQEAVFFVSGRTDLWAAFFLLIALNSWVRSAPSLNRWGLPWVAIGSGAFLMGCQSKETAILLPATLLAWGMLERKSSGEIPGLRGRKGLAWTLGLFLSIGLIALWRINAGVMPDIRPDWGEGAVKTGEVFLLAIRNMVFPWNTNPWYTVSDLGPSWGKLVAVFLVGVSGILLWVRGQREVLLKGLTWGAVFLLPVGLAAQPWVFFGDRYLYLPMIALALVTGAFLKALPGKWVKAAVVLSLVFFAGMTVGQGRAWRDEKSLYWEMIRKSPGEPAGFQNLGVTLLQEGRVGEGVRLLEIALEKDPSASRVLYNLGSAYLMAGRDQEALKVFEEADRKSANDPDILYGKGLAKSRLGDYDGALRDLRGSLKLRPGFSPVLEEIQRLDKPGRPTPKPE